jgi:ribosomal protein S26
MTAIKRTKGVIKKKNGSVNVAIMATTNKIMPEMKAISRSLFFNVFAI